MVEAKEDVGGGYLRFPYAAEGFYYFSFRAVLKVGGDVELYRRRFWEA